MAVTTESFGQTSKGEPVTLYKISNTSGMTVGIIDFGANITSICVPDRDGRFDDVVLGFDDVKGYSVNPSFFGSTIGRNANRIGAASFTLNGVTYNLEKNDGENNLHSHFDDCYNKKMFKGSINEADNSVTLSLFSPDGDQGFPGNLNVEITFRVTECSALEIEYKGTTDADTVFNLTNHSYFNLAGHTAGTAAAMDQKLWLNATHYTPTFPGSIPTGEVATVAGTPFDFTQPTRIGDRIDAPHEQLKLAGGYDHNWAVDTSCTKPEQIAVLTDEKSGRRMSVYTDLPGVQFYAGNFIANQTGKAGTSYGKRCAVCLETQFFPNAINIPSFRSPVLKAGETFKTVTKYKFSTVE